MNGIYIEGNHVLIVDNQGIWLDGFKIAERQEAGLYLSNNLEPEKWAIAATVDWAIVPVASYQPNSTVLVVQNVNMQSKKN